jgi:hypothetical protein
VRVLLATEGSSDEVVATSLIQHISPGSDIVPKQFASRGIETILRSIPTLVQAAHYQNYDVLVVHVDLNGTYDQTAPSLSLNTRCSDIYRDIANTIATLKAGVRPVPLRCVLMAPAQSTEAWLMWGNEDGNAAAWERTDRHWLKRQLYGDPPRGLRAKAAEHVIHLLERLQGSELRPQTLRFFLLDLINSGA